MFTLRLMVMCVFSAFVVCLLSFTVTVTANSDPSYVDPTDVLNFDAINMRMKDKKPDGTETVKDGQAGCKTCPPCPQATEDSVCAEVKQKHAISTSLLRQYSLSLVRLMETHVDSTSRPTLLDVRVSATYHGLAKLRKFGDGRSSDYHVLHETLTSLVQYAKPAAEDSLLSRFYWMEDKLGLSFPMMAYVTVLILSCVLLVFAIGHIQWRKQLLWNVLFVVFIASVILTMVEMYQEKVAEQEELLMESVRKHCPKVEEMGVWERVFSFITSSVYFKDDKCNKYMKAILVNPMVTVSPMQAVAVALVKTVVTPMELIGQGVKNFLVGLLKDLPVHLQTFVFVSLFVLLILWPLLLMGYNFNFFYLINIGPARVVREIQYVTAEPISSKDKESLGGQQTHPEGQPRNLTADSTHHSESQIALPAEASANRPALSSAQQAPSQNRQAETTSLHSSLTSRQPVPQGQTVQRTVADTTSDLRRRPIQRDGGDTRTDTRDESGVQDREISSAQTLACEDREVSSAQTLACGDRKGSELTSGELCHKLAQVSISEKCQPEKDKKQNCNAHVPGDRLESDKQTDPDSRPADSTELTGGIHKLNLENPEALPNVQGTTHSTDTVQLTDPDSSTELTEGIPKLRLHLSLK